MLVIICSSICIFSLLNKSKDLSASSFYSGAGCNARHIFVAQGTCVEGVNRQLIQGYSSFPETDQATRLDLHLTECFCFPSFTGAKVRRLPLGHLVSFSKYFLNVYYMLGTVLGTGGKMIMWMVRPSMK